MAKTPTIPEEVRDGLVDRLERHWAARWEEECRGVKVRFRGRYAYVDALEYGEDAPMHLCRLAYLGRRDAWGFGMYTYSGDRYQSTILPSGFFEGSPEECFDGAADLYLQNAF